VRGNTTEPMPDCDGAACLNRLVDFAELTADDVCLDVAYGDAPLAAAMSSRVRHVASVNTEPSRDTADTAPQALVATDPRGMRDTAPQGALAVAEPQRTADAVRASTLSLPYRDGVFTLVTARYSVHRLSDPVAAVREMLRVCHPGGRLVIAGRIRTNSAAAGQDPLDELERLRDPAHPGTPSLARLTGLLADAGANVRRLDVFVVERPAEPWLAGCDDTTANEIREALVAEIDGGPATGARPRMIGGELWFTQCCAHIAAVPA
jgi:SAM-dependent methyltransferase